MPTILMVDDQLGFLLWLGTVLDEVGYRAVPAKTVTEAARIGRVFPPNLLVINSELLSAAKLIVTLCTHNADLKVITLTEPTEHLENVVVIPRPAEITTEAGNKWLSIIANILGEHKVRRGESSFK